MLEFLKRFKIIIMILAIIVFTIAFKESIPLMWKIHSYSLSHAMRKILMFLLPFLIFPFMTTSIIAMKSRGAYLVGGILAMVVISNFFSIMIPFFVGPLFIPHFGIEQLPHIPPAEDLRPLFDFTLNPLLGIEATMALALICGLAFGYYENKQVNAMLDTYVAYSRAFFKNIFIPTLPIYVLGTILKASHEASFEHLLPVFGNVIMLILLTQLSYISLLFFIGAGGDIVKTLSAIKNSLHAGIVGFSTMSSIVTMPVTLKAAEQNIDDETVARVVISTTVNCHDVGECISLPMMALAIYFIAYGIFPSTSAYITFALFAAVAQFGGVAVPGGSIVILLPFLSQYLGFTDDMSNMLIILSIFMDPLGTANNVLGNSAFAMVVYRVRLAIYPTIRFFKSILVSRNY